LGHSHPYWVQEVQRQAGELVHTSNLFRNPLQARLASRIVDLAGPGRMFFCNSGTEANEALLKLARLHGLSKSDGKEGACFKVLTAKDSFHGRTFGSMAATSQDKVRKGFAPFVPGFAHGELNNIESFERLIDEQTAAILIEPVQGEGGIHVCTPEFLSGLRSLCDTHRLLLLLDEVQCGIGRTGRFFAFQHSGVQPDGIALAKGLGGGFPIGAIWVASRAADLFQPGSHGSTFGGNPLACAAALAVIEVMEREDLCANVSRLSARWLTSLRQLEVDYPGQIKEVRGCGFMIGIQLHGEARPCVAALREQGLLACVAGNNVLRLLPPLNVTWPDLEHSIEVIRTVIGGEHG